MASLESHPTVRSVRERASFPDAPATPATPAVLDAAWLREVALDAGADDVGFVSLARDELDDQREDILAVFPKAVAAISFVCRMNREPIRSPARSLANREFHAATDHTDAVASAIARALEDRGVRALNGNGGFPMETSRWPGKLWVVGHKPVAVAAGLGRMGIHRNVIHPKFGNFVLLGTVLVDRPISEDGAPVDYNPCLECKLCVAACPTGAIHPDGRFDFAACYTHNYRDFMGGFVEWVGRVADAKSAADYRESTRDDETVGMWQSLSYGPNYKAAYCLSVCPAGEDVIGPFLDSRKGFLDDVVRPLQAKVEDVYVVRGSDAEAHVRRRFPHKPVRHVKSSLRPASIAGFLRGAQVAFQPGRAGDMDATYHFTFTGREPAEATLRIAGGQLSVQPGRTGEADLSVRVDSDAWLGIVNGEKNPVWAVLSRKLRVRGPLALLKAFQRCFPG